MLNFLFAFICAWDFFFLSYSFVMFSIDFLLSIWVNLHIYIDIVFMGLIFELKFLLIIFLYCTCQIKYLYFFGEKSKMQPMSSSLGNDKFLFGMLYIYICWIWFSSEVKFGDFINFEILNLGVFGIYVLAGWS